MLVEQAVMRSTSGRPPKKGTEATRQKDGLLYSVLRSDTGRGVGG